jgi:transcriptional regulator with XRE-family HTH domain
MATTDQIARGIRRVRIEQGMRLSDVAERLGVHASTVSRIETGIRKGTWIDARTVADRLGVRVGYLLRDCPQCGYEPPAGYRCMRCGTPAPTDPRPKPEGSANG